MEPNLIKVTEIFLIPSSFLVAALGTADTNPHRFGVSVLGLLVSLMWLVCSIEALKEHRDAQTGPQSLRTAMLTGLSVVFAVGWLISSVVHAMLWNDRLGA